MPPKGARVLVDNCVPFGLVVALREITTFQYVDAYAENIHDTDDAPLLDHAERHSFSVLLTSDQSLVKQQRNRPNRPVGIVVVTTNDNDTAVANAQKIARAIQSITRPGKIVIVRISRPKTTTRNTSRH